MKIVIGSDHAGFDLKKEIADMLRDQGHELIDCGTNSGESVDYPDIAETVGLEALKNDTLGVLICGTGIGVCIAANKVKGIRAALCQNIYTARLAREHNNANVITIGARVTGAGLALEIVKAFIETDYSGGRHERRVEKIHDIEKRYAKEV